MRFLHVSDVHVDVPPWALPLSALFNKRLLGLANLVVRRYRRFSGARAKLDALARLRAEHEVDAVLCTGDLTALGTLPELAEAQRALAPLLSAPGGYMMVPGNHDVYVPDAADGRFERAFGEGLRTDAPHLRGSSGFPTCRWFGDHVAVVCVNSARPNPQPWRSSGRIPDHELDALRRLLDDPAVRERFVFVLTHYAPRRHDGTPDSRHHGLENADELLSLCSRIERGALLHGHLHRGFVLRCPELRIPVFCAGSATDRGREGAWLFDVNAHSASARRVAWTGERYQAQPPIDL
jgi:3',5'-cyclic AMP phosphodiesterase CpdA